MSSCSLLIFPQGNICFSFGTRFLCSHQYIYIWNGSTYMPIILFNYSSVPNVLPCSSRKPVSWGFLFLLGRVPSSTPHHPHPGLKLLITSLPGGYGLALASWTLFLDSLPHLMIFLLRAWWVFVSLRQRLWILFFYYFRNFFFKANFLASCLALLQKLANILRGD